MNPRTPLLALCLPALAAAQADDCSAPTPLATTGAFAFDTSANTASGIAICGPNMNVDGFWVWTAPTDGDFIFDTCGTTWDTRLALHAGFDCAAVCIQENDDTCGLQSSVTVSATTGDMFLVQLGGFGPGNFGPGTLNIAEDAPILNPGNGHYYQVVLGNTDWDTARADADASSYQGLPGHLVTIADQAELNFLLTLGVDRPWIGLFQDTAAAGYTEPGGGWTWVTGEPLTFVNWATGEPNDNPPPENHAEMFATGVWNDIAVANPVTSSYIIEYDGGGLALECDPANPHSGGMSATLANSSLGGPGVLHLEATDGPPGEFGYFLVSLNLLNPGSPISNGVLCLGSPVGRYAPAVGGTFNSIGQFDGAGVMQNISGTSTVGSGYDVLATLPTPPGGTIQAGTTYYFQAWFRDGTRSNFSNVLRFQ